MNVVNYIFPIIIYCQYFENNNLVDIKLPNPLDKTSIYYEFSSLTELHFNNEDYVILIPSLKKIEKIKDFYLYALSVSKIRTRTVTKFKKIRIDALRFKIFNDYPLFGIGLVPWHF